MPAAESGCTVTSSGPSSGLAHCDACARSVDNDSRTAGTRRPESPGDGGSAVIRFARPVGVSKRRSANTGLGDERVPHRTVLFEMLERDATRARAFGEQAALPCARISRDGVGEPDARCERLDDLEIASARLGAARHDRLATPRRGDARTSRGRRRPRAASSSAARRARARRCRSGTSRRRPRARACAAHARSSPSPDSIATGLPAVIHTARIGGSVAARICSPSSGSSDVRGAAFRGETTDRTAVAASTSNDTPRARDAEVAGDRRRARRARARCRRRCAAAPCPSPRGSSSGRREAGARDRRPLRRADRRRCAPVRDRPRVGERAKVVEVVAPAGGVGVRPAALEQHASGRHREREVAARPRLPEPIAQLGGAVVHRIDEHEPIPLRPRRAQHRQRVRPRHVDVACPTR